MHRRVEQRVEAGDPDDGAATIAATVHLPAGGRHGGTAPVIVSLPGGGYNRSYFDLHEPDYSEAAFHVARGSVVIAMDHLGVGESSVPSGPLASLPRVAEANHTALQAILARLREGSLAEGVAPLSPSAIVGEGHSMGGHITMLMQAAHRSFDALALLGSSFVCTRLVAADPDREICLLGANDSGELAARMAAYDWEYSFHWNDVPAFYLEGERAARGGAAPMPYWRSATVVDARELMQPGGVARQAASITVPVLLGRGERDVWQDSLREFAAFMSSHDIAVFRCPRMAHMHNFAGTRRLLWERVGSFVSQIAERQARADAA